MLRMSRCPLLLLWRIALIHAKLPDVIIQSVVIRNPQIGSKCDILLGQQFNKVLIGTPMGIRSLRADSKCCNEVTPGIANIVWPVKWLTMSAFIYPSIRRILSRTGPTIWHQFSPMAPSSSSLLEKVRNLPPFFIL